MADFGCRQQVPRLAIDAHDPIAGEVMIGDGQADRINPAYFAPVPLHRRIIIAKPVRRRRGKSVHPALKAKQRAKRRLHAGKSAAIIRTKHFATELSGERAIPQRSFNQRVTRREVIGVVRIVALQGIAGSDSAL